MPLKKDQIENFVKHQKLWGLLLLISWFFINTLVLATTRMMEFDRAGKAIPFWEPLCWESSSVIMILLLLPIGVFIHGRWLIEKPFKQKVLIHLLLTLPFSMMHIVGMVTIRHLCYWIANQDYSFGNWLVEFFYEYRKDAQTYLTLLLIIWGYRLIVYRLQGEASYIEEGDQQEAPQVDLPKPERLLIKKLGREFLIQVNNIEWVEASGNYANLHIGDSVYPMRITMEKLENLLPDNFVRIHRSTSVDIGQVKEIVPLDSGDYQVTLQQGKQLTLSRRYRENFKSLVN